MSEKLRNNIKTAELLRSGKEWRACKKILHNEGARTFVYTYVYVASSEVLEFLPVYVYSYYKAREGRESVL